MNRPVRRKNVLLGVGFLLVLALLSALSVAQYNSAFDRVVPISIRADRSGLLMEPGAAVKLRGVEVGSVAAVDTDGSGARLSVDLRPEAANRIPAALSVNLVPTTVFGAKYVELRPAAPESGKHIVAGAVIDRSAVTVELDQTFDAVLAALNAMPPSKLNGALSAVAGSLQGNGQRMGSLIVDLDGYLREFNPNLPELQQRIPEIAAVADDYRGMTDDFTSTAANFGVTSGTLAERDRAFAGFLLSMTEFGNTTGDFVTRHDDAVVTTLDTLAPSSELLARYSPIMPCFFGGVAHNDEILRKATGGDGSGVREHANLTLGTLPGIPGYRYPENLPKTGLDTGPDCHGLPVVDGIPPYVSYDTGANPYPNHDRTTNVPPDALAVYLFGPLTPLGGGR